MKGEEAYREHGPTYDVFFSQLTVKKRVVVIVYLHKQSGDVLLKMFISGLMNNTLGKA